MRKHTPGKRGGWEAEGGGVKKPGCAGATLAEEEVGRQRGGEETRVRRRHSGRRGGGETEGGWRNRGAQAHPWQRRSWKAEDSQYDGVGCIIRRESSRAEVAPTVSR